MSKYLKPKTWYLFGVGLVALAADGTRRIIKRRRQGEPVIPEEVSETVETKTRQAQAKGVEIEDKIEELAEPVVKPAKKAPKKAKAKVEAIGDALEEKAELVIERGEAAVAEADAKVETSPEKVEVKVDELAEPVEETAAKAAKKAEAVPALEFVKARTGKNGAKAGQSKSDVAPDDLTEIKGIGPTFARRLTEAGITTFADVANASPDYLREVTHAPAVAHPEEWIADAQNR
jgi:predicted flap endonuclease-1-like 5' DNA nuclease